MHNTNRTILFVLAMTVIVALILSGLFYGLKDQVELNEAVYNKKSTLRALNNYLDKPVDELTNQEVLDIFEARVEQKVVDTKGNVLSKEEVEALGYPGGRAEDVNMANERKKPDEERVWPIYKYQAKDGEDIYVIALRGLGLWDEIWGVVALASDLETITGVAFDHKGETPGLGAEIKDNDKFQKSFIGKSIMGPNGEYRGVNIKKGGADQSSLYEVDGISGATITADGVTAMFEVGVQAYENYLNKIKQ